MWLVFVVSTSTLELSWGPPGLPRWLSGKESASNTGDESSIPGLGRSPGEGNGNPLQYSCLGNPMDTGAWQATVHRVTKSQTPMTHRLNNMSHLVSINWIVVAGAVHLLSHVRLFATSWTEACQASPSFTIYWSLFKPMSIELVMPSNHLILWRPLLLLPSEMWLKGAYNE